MHANATISTLAALQLLTGSGERLGDGASPQALIFKNVPKRWRRLPVVDIGAHDASDFTIPAAQLGHRVYTYEPTAHKAERILSKLDGLGIAHTSELKGFARAKPGTVFFRVASAVSEAAGWAMFSYTPPGQALGVANSLNRGAMPTRQRRISRQANVTLVSLNDELAAEVDGVYLLKIDAQGQELSILRGAKGYLASHTVPIVHLEYNPKGLAAAGASPLELLTLLTVELGYTCFDMREGTKANGAHVPPLALNAFAQKYSGHEKENNGYGRFTDLQCIRLDLLR
jgi:FkbM family methyltransferase